MSEIPTRSEILADSSENGLMAYLFGIATTHPILYREKEFLGTVSELVNSGNSTLFSEKDWAFLDGVEIGSPKFFSGMNLLCELIPSLDVGHRDMMQLIVTLVRLGGKDRAAYRPNDAFRNWCDAGPTRVKAVIEEAKTGNNLAMVHLVFALEAAEDSSSALMFLNERSKPDAQIGAIVALGRMSLDGETAATAVRTLSNISMNTNNKTMSDNALLSIFTILEKNKKLPRKDARRALDKALKDSSADTLHLLSDLIWKHGKSLSEEEVQLILDALKFVDPEHRGTLENIDFAMSDLIEHGYFDALSSLVAELTKRSQGKIGINTFPAFLREIFNDNNRRLSKLVINWFLEGNIHLCRSLADQINMPDIRSQPINFQAKDIPKKPEEQFFICRKAVGHLFFAPVVATSLLVAVLRHGDDSLADDILRLLYNPLLMSYGDELRRYLEDIVEQNSESGSARVNEVLALRENCLNGFAGIDSLVELHPSETHRQVEHFRYNKRMRRAMQEAEEKSVFYNLLDKQNLLYGTAWSSYTSGPHGETHQHKGEMTSLSVSIEFPRLDTLDQVGLQMELVRFRAEQIKSQ